MLVVPTLGNMSTYDWVWRSHSLNIHIYMSLISEQPIYIYIQSYHTNIVICRHVVDNTFKASTDIHIDQIHYIQHSYR